MPALTTSGSPTISASRCTIDSTGPDQVQAPETLLDETTGWFAIRCVNPIVEDGILKHAFSWGPDGSNLFRFYKGETAQGGIWRFTRLNGGLGEETSTANFVDGADVTLIAKWTSSVVAISGNGEAFISLTSTDIPSLNTTLFDIGQREADHHLGTAVYWCAAGTGTLSDGDAVTINAFGNTDPTFGALPGTPTFLWTCTDFNYSTSGGATAPGVTQSLSATPGNAQIALSWTAPASNGGSAITGYKIYRALVPDGESGGFLVQPPGTGTTYTDTTTANGTTYYYRVSAVNAIGEGTWSNEAFATPASGTAPSAPLNPVATPGNNQIALTWSAPASNGGSAITAYRIYRSTTSGAETLYASPAGTGTSYTDVAATNGTTYYYKVLAVNAIGSSPLSSEASATPSAPVLTPATRTSKRFYGPALLSNAAATLYTVPASTTSVIRHVHVSNPTGSPVNFSLSIGASAAATRVWDAQPIPANNVLDHYQDFTLATGEIIQGFAGSASALNLTIDGYELGLVTPPPPPPPADIFPANTLFPSNTSP